MSVSIGDWVFNHAVYDDEVDVLYLSLDGPRVGFGDTTPEGDALRFDEGGEFYGVTIMGIQRRLKSQDGVRSRCHRQRVETAEHERVLARRCSTKQRLKQRSPLAPL